MHVFLDPKCMDWASQGECQSNPVWMVELSNYHAVVVKENEENQTIRAYGRIILTINKSRSYDKRST
ncbi:putative prolyl 4-hydroxylase [Dirofilaria immitis]